MGEEFGEISLEVTLWMEGEKGFWSIGVLARGKYSIVGRNTRPRRQSVCQAFPAG